MTGDTAAVLPWFTEVFVLLGAVGYGGTIAQLSYLITSEDYFLPLPGRFQGFYGSSISSSKKH